MSVPRSPLALEATRQILDTLDRGPCPVAELPRRWPVTRALIRICLADLEARGEVHIRWHGARRVVHPAAPALRGEPPTDGGPGDRRTAARVAFPASLIA